MLCVAALTFALLAGPASANPFENLFGYEAQPREDIGVIRQWAQVRDRAIGASTDWHALLGTAKSLPPVEQLEAVNSLANAYRYVVDAENYGVNDYWALPDQFIANGGDCEDFALFKLYALRALGWSDEDLRLVVVQDTQLGQPHAVLAVATPEGTRILDNQFDDLQRDTDIAHYAPVYSLSDERWWMHLPELSRSPSPSSRPAPATGSSPSGTHR